jgi:hypothetical protein
VAYDQFTTVRDFVHHYTAGSAVWRYMNLPKFRDLFETKTLYFTRLDQLDDPDEHDLVAASCSRNANDAETVYANCWHLSNTESATMWQQYAGDAGIAIRSSRDKLQVALNYLMGYGSFHYTASGPVWYRTDEEMAEFRSKAGERIDNFVPAFNKRLDYAHEQEFRLAISLQGASRPETHLRLPVNLHEIVDRIYVYKDASAHEVQQIANEANLVTRVQRATLRR